MSFVTQYGTMFQEGVLSLAMTDKQYAEYLTRYCRPEFFSTDAMKWLFGVVSKLFKQTRTIVDFSVMDAELNKLGPNDRMVYGPFAAKLQADAATVNADYIRQETVEWLQRSIFVSAHRTSADHYNTDDVDKAMDVMQRAITDIGNLSSPNSSPPVWMFRDAELLEKDRTEEYLKTGGQLARTGLPSLDAALAGGVRIEEFAAFLGDLKAGKSTFLDNLSTVNARMGNTTILVSLEGRRRQRIDRLEAWLSKVGYYHVRANQIPSKIKLLRQAEARVYSGFSDLILAPLGSEYKYTVHDLEDLMKQVRAEGLNPQVVVVDYCSLMYPGDGEIYKSRYESEGRVFREMRVFATRNKVAVFTADQARRPTTKKHHLKGAADTGDSYEKPRILDWLFSVNPDVPEEEDEDTSDRNSYEADIYLATGREKTRSTKVRVLVDWAQMQMRELNSEEAAA